MFSTISSKNGQGVGKKGSKSGQGVFD